MRLLILCCTLSCLLAGQVFAQTDSPYKTSLVVDGPVTVGAMGLSGLGLYLISQKSGMSEEAVRALSKDNVPKFDRRFAGNYDEDAKKLSDFGFYGSFALPLTLLLDRDIRSNAGQTLVLYTETMAITAALFTMANGLNERRRPLVYGNEAPMDEKIRKNAKNSFYAGHTAATASATFFWAKVYHDYNPDSPWRPLVWGVAAAVPAGVGYLRLKAGKHFLSDNLLGYGLGAGVGILVPQLHKVADGRMSLVPVSGEYNGVAMTYKF